MPYTKELNNNRKYVLCYHNIIIGINNRKLSLVNFHKKGHSKNMVCEVQKKDARAHLISFFGPHT